jgi:hypothetical protein
MRAKVWSTSLSSPVDAKLKAGLPVQLMLADEQDMEPLRSPTGSLSKKGAPARMTGMLCRWICGQC